MADQPQYKVFIIKNVIRQIKRYSIVKLVVSADSGTNHSVSNMCRTASGSVGPAIAWRSTDLMRPEYALSIVRTCYFAPNICSSRPIEPRFIEADRALGDLGKPQHNNVGYRSLRVEFSVDGSAYPGCLLDWADGDFRAGAQTK